MPSILSPPRSSPRSNPLSGFKVVVVAVKLFVRSLVSVVVIVVVVLVIDAEKLSLKSFKDQYEVGNWKDSHFTSLIVFIS